MLRWNTVKDVINHIKTTQNKIPNEESTKQHLVLPILMALGWDVFDPDEVMPEEKTGEGRPDYALKLNGKTVAFLEVKSVKEWVLRDGKIRMGYLRQLARYCFDRGVRVGILTNGLQWVMIKSFEPEKDLEERVILAVDLNAQEPSRAAERLRWLSKEKINQYNEIPAEYRKIPLQKPPAGIEPPHPTGEMHKSSTGTTKFRTLYVTAWEVDLPSSAIDVDQLVGKDLRGYVPSRLFVNFKGKWHEVSISHAENWPRARIAWSSITAMAVRFLYDQGIRDFPYVGKYLSKEPLSINIQYTAKIGDWYLYGPEGGKQAVETLHKLAKHTGTKIAIELQKIR
ncbi:type I restriction endonuclease [Thermococcus peptonophilus]|uniref:Restriction endonuclease type I HsdR N-terminal domain-containing protein n=1 Tax=Thermococcus peptonophilus TaxID=53952 RepID=A0A142CV90_9EURY|nr:type I restriction endonuclease [Thermococcus peptonophilus]AMQ18692.1 hypothetical protein A0127_05670 [Thermococcus peptonophilus]